MSDTNGEEHGIEAQDSEEQSLEVVSDAPPASESDAEQDADQEDDGGKEIPVEEIPTLARRVEALLFVSSKPMSARRLADLLEYESIVPIRQACEWLERSYDDRSFQLSRFGGGYQLSTKPQFEEDVLKLQKQRSAQRMSPGALETLAIVAYKQPISRAEIDAIRGVGSDHHMRGLAERNLVKVVGRQEVSQGTGAALYGTTTEFLNVFGIRTLSELPTEDDVSADNSSVQTENNSAGSDEETQVELEVVEIQDSTDQGNA